jgi:hypothetical protein
MYHVYSTMANSNRYAKYRADSPNGVRIIERDVVINGGSGINTKHIGTPLGIYTSVSDEDMDWLKDDFAFNQHIKAGYIRVEKHKVHTEVAAADMVTRDQKTDACPIVPEQFNLDGDKETIKPMTGKKKKAA